MRPWWLIALAFPLPSYCKPGGRLQIRFAPGAGAFFLWGFMDADPEIRQCIIVIHGRDVDHLFDPSFDLTAYLAAHVMYVCMDNLCHLSADKFLAKMAADAKKKAAAAAGDVVETKIKECLKDEATKNIVNEFADQLTPAQRIDAVQRIVNDYADVASPWAGDEAWRSENLEEFLKELVERLPANLTRADATFFMERLSKDFQSPHYGPMTEYFGPRYAYLPRGERAKFEDRLLRQWDKVIGDWMSENRMSVPTKFVWDHLNAETKKQLIGHFVEFVVSNRGSRHPQHQLADWVLEKDDSVSDAKMALRKHAKKAAMSWIEEGYDDERGLAKTLKSVKNAMRNMEQYIPDFDEQIKAAVIEAA